MLIDEVQRPQEVEEFLEHFGIKGMRWGVRRQRRNQALARAAKGNAGVLTKVRAFREENIIDLVKGRGIRGGAKIREKRLRERIQRLKAGKGSARDIVVHYGSTRMVDLIPVRRKNEKKKTTARTDAMVVAGIGALWVGRMMAKKWAKRAASSANL
jgi:hypothetical protein